MLLSLCDVLLSVQFINRCELHRRLRKQVLRFSVLAFSVAADWYLRFSYLHFPPLQIHTYVCISCIFHPQESRNFILPISVLAFSSTCTFSAPPPSRVASWVRLCFVCIWMFSAWQWEGQEFVVLLDDVSLVLWPMQLLTCWHLLSTTLLFVMSLLRSLMFLSMLINSGGFTGREGHAPVASPTVRLVCCMTTSHRYGSHQRPSFLICWSVSVYFMAMCYTFTSYICFVIL